MKNNSCDDIDELSFVEDAEILPYPLKKMLDISDDIWNIQPEKTPETGSGECTGIDVIIPCYLHAKYIENVVQSVIRQSYKSIAVHVLLMDDESIQLKEKLESLDSRVFCYKHSQLRVSAARNYLIDKCSYSHVLPLDADDPLEQTDLLDTFLLHSEYDIVMPLWEHKGKQITEPTFYNMVYYSQTTSLIKRDLFDKIRYDETLVHGPEDSEFFLRAYLLGASIKYSSGSFKKSDVTSEMILISTKFGSYDMMYKHRKHFIPILKEALKRKIDPYTLAKLRCAICLLESDEPKNYANMYELSITETACSSLLINSLPEYMLLSRLDNPYHEQSCVDGRRVCPDTGELI